MSDYNNYYNNFAAFPAPPGAPTTSAPAQQFYQDNQNSQQSNNNNTTKQQFYPQQDTGSNNANSNQYYQDPYTQGQYNTANQYYYNNNIPTSTFPYQNMLPLQYFSQGQVPQGQVPQGQVPQGPSPTTTPAVPQQVQNPFNPALLHQNLNPNPHQPPVPSYRTVPNTNYGVITTMWEDENTLCYQVEANGVNVVRRADNNFINGTKLLNVTKMTRGRRDGILKAEKVRHVVKIGSMHLKGVWIPFERAQLMAQRENILDLLYPLFVPDIEALLSGVNIHQQSSSINNTVSNSDI